MLLRDGFLGFGFFTIRRVPGESIYQCLEQNSSTLWPSFLVV